MSTNTPLPEIGFMRLREVLAIFPIGRSTFWAGVKSGKYPKPIKLSERCTAWRVTDIHNLIASYENTSESEVFDKKKGV